MLGFFLKKKKTTTFFFILLEIHSPVSVVAVNPEISFLNKARDFGSQTHNRLLWTRVFTKVTFETVMFDTPLSTQDEDTSSKSGLD